MKGRPGLYEVLSLKGLKRCTACKEAKPFSEFVKNGTKSRGDGLTGRCGICGEFIEGDFHVDHVLPLSQGGLHGYINVQPAHPICNFIKGAGLQEAA
jgi:5-methylcytosine-specific restriction endonuclease McrA